MATKLVAFVVILLLATSASAQDSPDDTTRVFFNQLKKQDLPGMVNCFATDSLVDLSDLRQFARSNGTIPSSQKDPLLPNDYKIFGDLNRMSLKASVYGQIHLLILRMVSSSNDIWMTKSISSNNDIDALIDDLNPDKLSSLEILNITNPFDEKSKEIIDANQKENGLPAIADRVVLVRVQQREFVVPLVLVKLDEKWGIVKLGVSSNNIVGLSKISQQEYMEKFVASKFNVLSSKPFWKP